MHPNSPNPRVFSLMTNSLIVGQDAEMGDSLLGNLAEEDSMDGSKHGRTRDAVDIKAVQTVNLMWSGAFGSAEALLKPEVKEDRSARDMVHLIELRFIIQVCSGNESDVDAVLRQVKQSQKWCDRILESSEEMNRSFESLQLGPQLATNEFLRDGAYKLFVLDTECCSADIRLFKGIYQILMGREIKGTSTLRSSLKLYQKLQNELASISYANLKDIISQRDIDTLEAERKSLQHCVSFGIAFFFLLLDIVPSSLAAVFQAIGFRSNKPLALTMLHSIINSNSIRAPLSRFVVLVEAATFLSPVGVLRTQKWADDPALSALESLFSETDEVLPSIREGVNAVGSGVRCESPIFNLLGFHLHQKLGLSEESVVLLDKAVASLPTDSVRYPAVLWFEVGCQHAIKGEFAQACQIFNTIWSLSPEAKVSPQTVELASSFLFSNDWFEIKPMSGLLWVACSRAMDGSEPNTGGSSFETAKHVRKEILLAVSSRKIKKTRIIKFALHLLEWLIYRPGGIHPLLLHTILALRRDPHRLILNPSTTTQKTLYTLLTSLHQLTSHSCGLEDSTGKILTLYLQGTYLKCWLLASLPSTPSSTHVHETVESLLRESFQTCLEFPWSSSTAANTSAMAVGVAWVAGHARFEVAELDTLMQGDRWVNAQRMMLGAVNEPRGDGGDGVDESAPGAVPRSWGAIGEDEGEEGSDELISGGDVRTGVRRRASNISLGSVEVLEEGLIERRLETVLEMMKEISEY
ncbi:Tetratricopeptide repeat protein 39C [Podochytrium sp. JEL0797]|nr:Tetratricopeptide repeat protein 39C [Podochytrium sp. JEL0797]